MEKILYDLQLTGIIPVVKIDNLDDALPLAKALSKANLMCAEITYRTDAASAAIRKITDSYPDMLIGAGTVLNIKQVDEAVEAGAKFIVSPGLDPKVVNYCKEKDIIVIPGCSNPSDIEQAIELGLDTVKFFPAELTGGIKMIKTLGQVYTDIKFIPTGGINIDNMNDYLNYHKIIACGGSWMVKSEFLKSKNYNQIENMCKEAIYKMLGFEIVFPDLTIGDKTNEDKKEKMHVVIRTNHIKRAVFYLKKFGYEFNEDSIKYDEALKMKSIDLKDKFEGLVIELLQK